MPLPAPLLAQVSERSRRIQPIPVLEVGRDGLLRRQSMSTPLVEELLSDTIELESGAQSMLETISTRAYPDQPDPLIRAESRKRIGESDFWLSTIITRGDDPPDPSGVRRSSRNVDWVSTIFSNGKFDPIDPNRSRRTMC
jgi:hypothetical protein